MSQRGALLLTLLIASVTTTVCVYCFWGLPRGRPRGPLEIVPRELNVGQVWLYEDKDFETEVQNAVEQVVEIGRVRVDCACANVKLETLRLEPGSVTSLTGTLQGRRTPGEFARRLVLIIEKPTPCQYVIPIVGEARRRISFSPQTLVLQPNLSEGKPGVATLVVHNGAEEAVKLSLSGDPPSGISASVEQAELSSGESGKIRVEADPSLVIAAEMELELDCSHRLEKTLKVPVELQPVEGVVVAPDKIAFGVLSREKLLGRGSVALELQGELVRHCEIDGVSCPEYLKVETTERQTPAGRRIELAIRDSFERADLGGTIAVDVRDKRSKRVFRVEVEVSGFLTNARGDPRDE